jgi:DNA-directed RNA polymerase specialized sigma24 family protein
MRNAVTYDPKLEAAIALEFAALMREDEAERAERARTRPGARRVRDELEEDQPDDASTPYPFEPAPCDKCINRRRCALERLACRAFVAFVKHPGIEHWQDAARRPSRRTFVQIFAKGRATPIERVTGRHRETIAKWVKRCLDGDMRLSIADRREAVRELIEEGMSQQAIGEVLGVATSTVSKDLTAGSAYS